MEPPSPPRGTPSPPQGTPHHRSGNTHRGTPTGPGDPIGGRDTNPTSNRRFDTSHTTPTSNRRQIDGSTLHTQTDIQPTVRHFTHKPQSNPYQDTQQPNTQINNHRYTKQKTNHNTHTLNKKPITSGIDLVSEKKIVNCPLYSTNSGFLIFFVTNDLFITHPT